jgi:hypothetical protein
VGRDFFLPLIRAHTLPTLAGPLRVRGRPYGNYVADEGEAIDREAYGPNYDRLVALKNKYDPTNFFRMNQRSRQVRQH